MRSRTLDIAVSLKLGESRLDRFSRISAACETLFPQNTGGTFMAFLAFLFLRTGVVLAINTAA
jgi:hypothetical protein